LHALPGNVRPVLAFRARDLVQLIEKDDARLLNALDRVR